MSQVDFSSASMIAARSREKEVVKRQLDIGLDVIDVLPTEGVELRTVFLEASDEALVRRFESSRRPHPLQRGERILDALQAERILLAGLRESADLVIDTTDINVHGLRQRIDAAFADDSGHGPTFTVLSFGFKYGIPVDADLVADARFLPNPYWDEALRPLTGLDPRVAAHVLEIGRAHV